MSRTVKVEGQCTWKALQNVPSKFFPESQKSQVKNGKWKVDGPRKSTRATMEKVVLISLERARGYRGRAIYRISLFALLCCAMVVGAILRICKICSTRRSGIVCSAQRNPFLCSRGRISIVEGTKAGEGSRLEG